MNLFGGFVNENEKRNVNHQMNLPAWGSMNGSALQQNSNLWSLNESDPRTANQRWRGPKNSFGRS